jgi:hypothetical protein
MKQTECHRLYLNAVIPSAAHASSNASKLFKRSTRRNLRNMLKSWNRQVEKPKCKNLFSLSGALRMSNLSLITFTGLHALYRNQSFYPRTLHY